LNARRVYNLQEKRERKKRKAKTNHRQRQSLIETKQQVQENKKPHQKGEEETNPPQTSLFGAPT
jgi:hypothetical protein